MQELNPETLTLEEARVDKGAIPRGEFPDRLVINRMPVLGRFGKKVYLSDIPPRFKIKDLFPDYNGENSEDEYKLVDFVHYSGSGSGGHYTYYHKDDDGQWRVYNDSRSSPVVERTVLQRAASNGRSFMFRKVSASVE